MPAYHYGTDVLLETPRRCCARDHRTPLQLVAFISSVALELVRGEGRETLQIQAARVAAEFAELTDWQKRRLG